MRLLNDLMFGLGEERNTALRDVLRDFSPMSAQDETFSPMTCGCAFHASKIDYTPTLNASEQFRGDFATQWAFQGEPTGWQAMLPNDGPQEINESGGDIIPGGVETGFTLTLGQSETGTINTENDRDWFAVTLVAGQTYQFDLVSSGANPLTDPYLELRNEFGAIQAIDDDGGPGLNSRITFTAATSGTYFLNARSFDNANQTDVGDYTISFNTGTPQNPLNTLAWNYAFPDLTINVYFTTQGESFGQNSDTSIRNWTQAEINSVMSALASISAVTPLVFTQVFSSVGSDFRLTIADLASGVLGRFFIGAGNGSFDPDGVGWSSSGMAPGSLGYATIVHEILHGLGLAHPHDNGGGSEIMQGVTNAFNSFGTFNMNQGVFTTMSYNDGWVAPFGSNTSTTTGAQGGPMALDIARLQQLYGATAANTGNNTYTLNGANGAYLSIWDTGGTDVIQYSGALSANIDLRAASLTTAFGGGGWVSYVTGFHSGFTIANNVVIENATGGSGNDTLIGNDVANILTGNNGSDTLTGNGGADTLDGGAGVDDMSGGGGDDTYNVDSSSDFITENADEGVDSVNASATYSLTNNIENLTLLGSDALSATGNALNNVIVGNSGANFINGGAGADTMSGGDGNDNFTVDNAGDTVSENANEGTDRVFASVSFVLGENVENLTLTGVDAINGYGNALANTLLGNDAANILDGGAGADTMTGGLGNDSYYVDDAGDSVVEDPSSGTDTVFASITYTIAADLENLTLIGGAAINGTGNSVDNTIFGNGQINTLIGLAGNDTIDAGGGDDFLYGGDNNDTLYGRAGADTLDGEGGNNTLEGGGGDDTYIVRGASDVVVEISGAGIDTLISTATRTLGTAQENLTLTGVAAINGFGNILANTMIGNEAANTLNGVAGTDTLSGNGGNDTLNGGDGNDTLSGGADNDLLDGGNNEDTLNGGEGNDQLFGRTQNDTLNGDGGADTIFGGDGDDVVNGGADNDLLDGINGNDTISGGNGDDEIYGRQNNDTLNGDAGLDTLYGGDGDDVLNGGGDADLLDAGNGVDTLNGDAGDDTLYGRNGNDRIDGGLGADTLYGGNDADTYVFSTAIGGGNIDVVAFSVVEDTIELSLAIFSAFGATLDASELRIGSAAVDADDYIIYDPVTGALYYDADGDGAGSAVQFATLGTGLALTFNDFVGGP
jgi:Ca2+-binding RTX toxin-like protein